MTLHFSEKSVSQSVSSLQLFLLRHGETDWNAEKRLQGRTDTSLNAKGRAQAKRHGAELAKIFKFSSFQNNTFNDELAEWHFVSSPLKRCRETLELVLEALGCAHLSYDLDDRLTEISFGEWEGQRWDELRLREPELVAARFDNPWEVCAPGAETYSDLEKRVLDWYSAHPPKTIAVTHSGPSRIIRRAVSQMPRERILDLQSPQDRFMNVHAGGFDWI